MARRKDRWALDPKDIGEGWSGHSSVKVFGNFERKLKVTSRTVNLTHTPTGIKVYGEIPDGHYSRKEMRSLTEKLREKLWAELENKVARHLKIPGR